MIKRILESRISKRLFGGKVLIIYVARQVGKTTLIKQILNPYEDRVIWLNCDEPDVRQVLSEANSAKLRTLAGKKNIVVIDEAQRVENIGLTLKLFTDNHTDIQVIASGSSSLELADKISEPLTGRKFVFELFPLSFREMVEHTSLLEERRMFEHRLIYGYYPEIVNNPGDETERLQLIADSLLYKDILSMDLIKKPAVVNKLLRSLALQIGSEVSYKELGVTVGADNETVEKYIDLLEKSFIIFKLGSFSRNARNEIKKGKKIYFTDNGIRNALIRNFNPVNSRTDKGALLENFLISERMKKLSYEGKHYGTFFWRTQQQQEIDYVEEYSGTLSAFEIKWSLTGRAKIPSVFRKEYPEAVFRIVSAGDFEEFIM